jgi:YhcH/YjgK/YiaL family protein
MIIDQIANSHIYSALHPRLRLAFDTILQIDLASLAVGMVELDGENLYAMVQQYSSKPIEEGLWEAHRRYMDLQLVIQGTEKTHGKYDAAKDFVPLFGQGDFLTLQTDNFVLLLPQDAHMTGIAVNAPAPVRKIVFKISIL